MASDPMPTQLEPMLAKHALRPPEGDDWAFELKWDGVRAIAYADRGEVTVRGRRGEDATPRYPELTAAGASLASRRAIFDGEVVCFDPDGRPSFQLLQRRMGLTDAGRIAQRRADTPVTYVAFDLLWLDGRELFDLPYEERRELLTGLGVDAPTWQVPRHHLGDGAALLGLVRERRLEGIVAKRLGSLYRPGRRTSDWLKTPNRRRQEVVIGGYMPGEGGRSGRVGSLLVGHWDATPEEAEGLGRPQRLVYAGGVGTGFTDEMLARLTELLAPLRRDTSPFELGWDPQDKYRSRVRERGALVWCEPELVCEVEFSQWTHEGTLRQAAFKGLRDDKGAREVVRES